MENDERSGAHAAGLPQRSVAPRLPSGATPLEPDDPVRIGVYTLLGRLGVGGMGIVYLGQSPGRTLVAVKLVHSHLSRTPEFRARFAAEIGAARRLPAFCTAPVRDQGEYLGRPYLVSEYLEGTPLSRMVAEEGPLDPGTLHNVAIGAAAALAAIHQLRLIHRDMKPSNLIVTPGGVRVIDFGIVKALDGTGEHTTTGVVMASPGWASPEQLAGEPLTSAVDVFAWGCVIAYAGTGFHPYGNGHPITRAWQIMYGEPELDGLPEPIRGLIGLALQRDPARRPSVADLLIALVGDGRLPVRAPAPVEAEPARPRRGRRRLALFGTSLVALFTAAALAAAAWPERTGGAGNDPQVPGGSEIVSTADPGDGHVPQGGDPGGKPNGDPAGGVLVGPTEMTPSATPSSLPSATVAAPPPTPTVTATPMPTVTLTEGTVRPTVPVTTPARRTAR